MGLFRRNTHQRVARLRAERDQIEAELEVARQEAAWCRASEDPFEIQEGDRWARTAETLETALERADRALFRAELDQFGTD